MHLTLHLPALGAADPRDGTPLPHIPILEILLGRAQYSVLPHAAPWIHEAFGYADKLPMARLLAHRDGVTWGERDILLAEPVHMVADRDTVRLYPASHLALDPIEVASMTGALESQFADLGLRFAASDAGRLYVRMPISERPHTTPAPLASTRPLLEVQPRSLGTLKWHAIQSETEMLLHDHPVNILRDKYGKPRVSGLWFWGEGDLLTTPLKPFDVVTTDTDWVKQLAREAGIATGASDWSGLGGVRLLVHIGSLEEARIKGDATRWAEQLTTLEKGWIRQIDHGLWNGNIESLTLISESRGQRHQWFLPRLARRYFVWKRPRPLSHFFGHAQDHHA
jgi:hypothetical protein